MSKSQTVASADDSETQVDAGEVEPQSDTKDIVYNPILPAVSVQTLEEEEEVIAFGRGKLYRFANESDPPEWKERGVGEWRLLRHAPTGRVRFLLRRDKTLKLGANHRVLPSMSLAHHGTGDGAAKTWMWTTAADLAEDTPRKEHFCLRFRTPQLTGEFEQAFERAKRLAGDGQSADKSLNESSTQTPNDKSNDSVASNQSSGDQSQSVSERTGQFSSPSKAPAPAPAAPKPTDESSETATVTTDSPNKECAAGTEGSASLAASLEKLAIAKAEKDAPGDES